MESLGCDETDAANVAVLMHNAGMSYKGVLGELAKGRGLKELREEEEATRAARGNVPDTTGKGNDGGNGYERNE